MPKVLSPHAHLVGRHREVERIKKVISRGRHVLLEGPVGVGKTTLALHVCHLLKQKWIRIDGDGRYSEQKLVGWFDPPMVIKKGFTEKTFQPGPLVQAMRHGTILLLNELNRLPEGVQNVLLPAIDERQIQVPHLGTVYAKKGFSVIATQNPKEYVATSLLSEALMDRFEWVPLGYLPADEEIRVLREVGIDENTATLIANLLVETRAHDQLLRGASLRAGLSMAAFLTGETNFGTNFGEEEFVDAAIMSFTTRVEVRGSERPSDVIAAIARQVFQRASSGPLKSEEKKSALIQLS